jgi:hypothetical protein
MKISARVKDKIASTIATYFTTNEIARVFSDLGVTANVELYAKRSITLDAIDKLSDKMDIVSVIKEFCHPLNFKEQETRPKFVAELNQWLAYDDLAVKLSGKNASVIEQDGTEIIANPPVKKSEFDDIDPAYLDELFGTAVPPFVKAVLDQPDETEDEDIEAWSKKVDADVAQQEQLDKEFAILEGIAKEMERETKRICDSRELLIKIRDHHQAYIDVLEIFCEEMTKPNSKLNSAYTKLARKISEMIDELALKHKTINFYKPFGDLYSAESDFELFGDVKVSLTWDSIRPRLYKAHSDITHLVTIAEQDLVMSDDEKELDDISSLISSYRTSDEKTIPETVQKIEISYKKDNDKTEGATVSLAENTLIFDSEIATLYIGTKQQIKFPLHKNEHAVLTYMFSVRKGEGVDWELVYEAISGVAQDKVHKADIAKCKKSVSDAVLAINKRISELSHTEQSLVTMRENNIIRHYGP